MTAEWVTVLIDVSLKATMLLVAACMLAVALRRASAATRHLVWSAALAGIVAMPAVSRMVPSVQVPVSADSFLAYMAVQDESVPPVPAAPPIWTECRDEMATGAVASVDQPPGSGRAAAHREGSARGLAPVTHNVHDMSLLHTDGSERGVSGSTAGAVRSADLRGAVGPIVLIVWSVGAALVFMRLILGTASVWWIARRTRPLTESSWQSLLADVSAQLGLPATLKLLKGRRAASPMAWGIVRPVVLLPEEADDWTVERRRVVLLHELGHIKRRDCLTQAIAHLACTLYWFNPLVWVASGRLQAERERACDDLVLRAGTSGGDYARHLLDIARSLRPTGAPAWATVGMARRSELEGRLLAILDSNRRRHAPDGVRRIAGVALAVLLVVSLSVLRPAAPAQALATVDAEIAVPQNQPLAPTPLPMPDPVPQPLSEPSPVIADTFDIDQAEIAELALEDLDISGAVDELAIADSVQEALENVDMEAATEAISALQHKPARAFLQGMQSGGARDPKAAEQAAQALVTALKDSDPEVRMQAAHALGELRSKAAVPALIAALKDDNTAVRRAAISALGELRDPASVDALVQALKDPDPGVGRHAIAALGELRDRRAVPGLVEALKSDDVRVKVAVLSALAEMRDDAAVSPAIALLNDPSPEVRSRAAMILAELRDPRAVEPLVAALKDGDARVRQRIVSALAELRDNRAVPGLLTAMQDDDPGVRQRAIMALAEVRDTRAVEPLIGVLKDPNAALRQRAVMGLAELRDPRAVEPLVAAMQDEDPAVRQRAIMALAELRDSRAVPALIGALKDPQPSTRQRAVMALGEIRDSRAVEPLIGALKDADAGVRQRAALALAELRDGRAIDALTAALNDQDPGVRRRAVAALRELGSR